MPIAVPVCQDEEDLRRILIERSAQGFLVLRGKCIIYANSTACQIFGCTSEEMINNCVENIVSPEDVETDGQGVFIDSCIDRFSENKRKLHFKQKNGSNVWIQAKLSLINYQGTDALLMAFSDITDEEKEKKEQVRCESERLQESQNKYRQLVEVLQEGVWALDLDGFTTFANPSMAQMLGYTVDEMQGRHLFSFTDERGATLAKNYLERRKQGIKEQHDFEFIRKDGSRIYTTLSAGPLKDAKGKYIGALAGVKDITARKNAEDRLWKANRELVALNRCNESLAHAQNEELLLKEICKIVVQTCGYKMAWIGYAKDDHEKIVLPIVHYEKDDEYHDIDCERGKGPASEAIWTGKPSIHRNIPENPAFNLWHYEAMKRGILSLAAIPIIIGCHAIGSLIIYSSEKDDFDDEDVQFLTELADNLAYGIKASRDHLDRMQAEARLRAILKQREALLNNIPDSAWLKDKEGRYIAVNKSFAGLCGQIPKEIAGKSDNDIWPGILAERHIQDDKEVMQSRTEKCVVEPSVDKLGNEAWIETIRRPMLGEKGEVVGTVGIARDITAHKKAEERLKRYSEHLEDLVEERSRQLRDRERLAAIGETAVMIGHDLRNPLQAIVNTIYLARQKVEEPLPEANLDKIGLISDLATMEKQSLYMNKIVCNLLDYSRPLNPDMVDLSLPSLISDTLASMNIPDNIEIRTKIEEGITLRVDPTMIVRVLINIISNAIQAMPEGGMLDIFAFTTEKDVILTIKDTGPGIPLEVKNKIFLPLITTKAKGMGMGLVVCKRLMEAMGGDIRLVSEKCRGTIAEIKIPTRK